MAAPASLQRVWGESYDQLAGPTYPQLPIIDGPYYLNALPMTTDFGIRLCVFYNPWGGVEPARFPNVTTGADWFQIYPEAAAPIDWTKTGGFTVYAQNYWQVGVPFNNGFDQWMHKGNDVPDSSDGQSKISCGFVTMSIGGVADPVSGITASGGYDNKGVYWSFNPHPPAPGIGRDGYYAGSHKMTNGLSGTMPGVEVQTPGDLQILVLAHLNLDNAGNIQTTQHGGPQDVGWTYQGINRPHRFFYTEPRQWGVVMSVWSKVFNDYVGPTGAIPWRTNLRDTDYSMQSMLISIRGKSLGPFGGMFS